MECAACVRGAQRRPARAAAGGRPYGVGRFVFGRGIAAGAYEMALTYQREAYPAFGVDEFIDILVRSTLAERRPMEHVEALRGMLEHADLILTARDGERLVGIARSVTDYHLCVYLSDLAVDVEYQGRGIGRELIRLTHEAAGLHATLILLAAPGARSYYPHIGLTKHDFCWTIPGKPREALGESE